MNEEHNVLHIRWKSIRVSDFNGDSDLDLAGAALDGNEIAWWRNEDGSSLIWKKPLIDSLMRVWPLYACDLDSDGDIDIVAGSGWRGKYVVKR